MFVGKKAGEMPHFVNVLDYADAGKVDPHSPEDGSFDNLDLDNIRRFVQLDIRLRTQGKETVGYGRTIPSIARQVLVSFWEEPRTGFHYKEIEGLRKPVDFGSKRLDVPWSEEAYLRFKRSGDVKGLLLEHVTPIKDHPQADNHPVTHVARRSRGQRRHIHHNPKRQRTQRRNRQSQ